MNGRGFALIRGLPVEDWSIEQSAKAYFGIGTILEVPVLRMQAGMFWGTSEI